MKRPKPKFVVGQVVRDKYDLTFHKIARIEHYASGWLVYFEQRVGDRKETDGLRSLTDRECGRRNHHHWITSVNERCPGCQGKMQLCEHPSCYVYRCAAKCKRRYLMTTNRFNEQDLVEEQR